MDNGRKATERKRKKRKKGKGATIRTDRQHGLRCGMAREDTVRAQPRRSKRDNEMAPDGGMERWTQDVEGTEFPQSCDALLET